MNQNVKSTGIGATVIFFISLFLPYLDADYLKCGGLGHFGGTSSIGGLLWFSGFATLFFYAMGKQVPASRAALVNLILFIVCYFVAYLSLKDSVSGTTLKIHIRYGTFLLLFSSVAMLKPSLFCKKS